MWIETAEEREHFWAFVNTVLNVCVTYEAADALTNC